MMGAFLMPARKKAVEILRLNEQCASLKMIRILLTFSLVNFAWIFFQADSFASVIRICKRFWHPCIWELFDGTLYTLGLNGANLLVMVFGVVLLIVVDILNNRGIFISNYIAKERLWVRWPVYITAIMLILICGIWGTGYDTASFIYYQF